MSDAPDLAAALTALPGLRSSKGPQCTVGAIVDRLATTDPAAHQALIAVVDRDDVLAAKISEVLSTYGQAVKTHTVLRHRKRGSGNGCSCPPPSR